MSRALAIHLPGDLDTLAKVLGLSEQKDKEGSTLMKKMMSPAPWPRIWIPPLPR